MSAEHIAACLRHEADNPGAMYVNDEGVIRPVSGLF